MIVAHSRQGLGFEVAKQYSERGYETCGTARSSLPKEAPEKITWIKGVDVSESSSGKTIVDGLKGAKPDIVVVTAGLFPREKFDEPDVQAEIDTYKIVAM